MKKSFKKLCVVCSLILTTVFAVSCGGGSSKSSSGGHGLKIVVTTFPIYDWVSNVLGDNLQNVELSMIINTGVDLHSFQPSTDDIIKIANADLVVYTGGVSEEWIHAAIDQSKNENMVDICLIHAIGNRVIFDDHGHHDHDDHDHHEHGHEGHGHDEHKHEEHDHKDEHKHDEHKHEGHDHDHDHHHDHGHDDEHIWLSLVNAQLCVDAITAALAKLEPEQASVYFTNAGVYNRKLQELDAEYSNMVASKSKNTVIIADRFPFTYMFEDYDLENFAAFSGCSAESEASFETIKFLAEKADEIQTKTIVKTKSSGHNIAETVKNATSGKNQEIIVFDSMEDITGDQLGSVDYISIMKSNLDALSKALTY